MKLVLLGAPGAGKGTQAALLKTKHKIEHISTGDIFRHNLKNNTPLGLKAKEFMDVGELVPDELVNQMVADTLKNLAENQDFMLDGFPRTIEQAKFLEGVAEIDGVILFTVPDEEIIKRLTSRGVCRDCGQVTNIHEHDKCPSCSGELYIRDDDNETTIKSRLKVFHEQTEQLIAFYKNKELLYEVEAKGTPEEIFVRVQKVLRNDKD